MNTEKQRDRADNRERGTVTKKKKNVNQKLRVATKKPPEALLFYSAACSSCYAVCLFIGLSAIKVNYVCSYKCDHGQIVLMPVLLNYPIFSEM